MSVDLSKANEKELQACARPLTCSDTSRESSSVRLVINCFDKGISPTFLSIFLSQIYFTNICRKGLTIYSPSEKGFRCLANIKAIS